MKSIAKLKDRARKHEQKEDWGAAIKAYQQVLESEEGEDEVELELGLFNRIGDLYLRLGQTEDAVSYYVTAADKYADSGFFNNSIALCNKALRHRPGKTELYLKLSRLCAQQGFFTDARRWILEYSEREMKAGNVEAAVEGLAEFAELSEDPEIREILAQHLASSGRVEEAVDQLERARQLWLASGEAGAAERVVERARALDPEGDPGQHTGGEPDERIAGMSAEAAVAPETSGDLADELEPRHDALPGDTDVTRLHGLEATAAHADEAEPEATGVDGLEVSGAGPEGSGAEGADSDLLGGLETFGPGPGDTVEEEAGSPEEPAMDEEAGVVDPDGFDEYDEEEAEPLPLLDTGYEDDVESEPAHFREESPEPGVTPPVESGVEEEAPEDPSPLPVLDTGFEDDVESAPAHVQPDEAESDEAESEEFPLLDLNLLDMAGLGGDPESGATEPMDPELAAFDLGFETETMPKMSAADLDLDAILTRAKQQVSRGLRAEALAELRLLSSSDAGPEIFRDALSVVNEIVRYDANDVGALQRRVEYAARIGERGRLADAYIDLADALGRLGAEVKAQAMYQRVLDLDPENEVAREALGLPEPGEEEATLDLGAVLREVEADEPEVDPGDSPSEGDADFSAMLSRFKAKVTGNVEAEEASGHYDLGLAFKEMGLLDEAIAEFQTALTGGTEQLKVYEELGKSFVLKGQFTMAVKVFTRALSVPYGDEEERLGVYYHLGQSYEELGQRAEAREVYEKILAIDDSFADVPSRMAEL